ASSTRASCCWRRPAPGSPRPCTSAGSCRSRRSTARTWAASPASSAPPTWPAGAEGTGMPRLRVLSYNVHGQRDDRAALAAVVRGLAPDVAVIQEAPRRLRWRTRCADLARRLDLVHAGGGAPAVG